MTLSNMREGNDLTRYYRKKTDKLLIFFNSGKLKEWRFQAH